MAPTLVLAGALSILTGGAFAYVGRAIARRPASPANRGAMRAAGLWWLCLGAYMLLQGGLTLAAGLGAFRADVYLASRLLAIPLLCTAVWGLTYHIVYLYTGSRQAGPLLGAFFGLVAAVFLWATFAPPRPAVIVTDWLVGLDDTSPLIRVVYLAVGLPPIAASLAYLNLLRRVQDPEQRRRIILLSVSILAYIGGGLAARLGTNDLLKFATLVVLGVLAAMASLATTRTLHAPPEARS